MPLFDAWAEREEAVFIVGPPRSGTTVMYRTLSEAPGFWALAHQSETSAFLRGALHQRPLRPPTINYLGNRYDSFIAAADANEHSWLDQIRLFFYEASLQYQTGRLLEKTPDHIFHIEAIMAAFPRARVIIMMRGLRDIVISHRVRYARDNQLGIAEAKISWLRAPIEQLLKKLNRVDRAISEALSVWPDRTVCVSYDQLIERPILELKTIGERLGMPTDDIDAMIGKATRERVAAPDQTDFPARDSPIGRTLRRPGVLTPAEELAIASCRFVHLRA